MRINIKTLPLQKINKNRIMSTLIANPIYDSVFKYMIANNKVAKILLSALLKKNVVKVVQINNEYAVPYSDDLSICRIDFGATISEEIVLPDGKTELRESMVTIELQKVYLPSEVLRFRQYTGIHYCNPEMVHKVNNDIVKEAADPMISVFILGHKLDVIDECVCYISREYRDYNGNKMDIKDPFAESLSHDSIIVQVPLLPNDNVKNRVEELLQVINQSRKSADGHFISIDESKYKDDEEVNELIRTLKGAACDSEIRRTMMLEDEVLRDIKDLNATVRLQKEQLAEQNERLAEQKEQLAEQNERLAEQKEQLEFQRKQLVAMASKLHNSGRNVSEIASFMEISEEMVKFLLNI